EKATLLYFRQHARYYIVPLLGQRKLCDFTPVDLTAFRAQLKQRLNGKGQPMSHAMLRRVRTSLGSVLALAFDQGLVGRNVVRDRGRQRRSTNAEKRNGTKLKVGVDIPTPAEIGAILSHAKPRWRPVLATAAMTGLRASELRGLKWQDVNLKQRELHVRQVGKQLQNRAATCRSGIHPERVEIGLPDWRVRIPQRQRQG